MKSIKILIIEDDELAANCMQDFLQDCNFDVEVFHTVTDGLSHIKYTKYDILLLDLTLPDFSGLDMLKMIKNSFKLPVIIISAHSDTQIKVKAFNYGASDYMVKPIDLAELEARIWSLLGRYSEIKTQTQKEIFRLEDSNIFFKDKPLKLTSTEYQILKSLLSKRNFTLQREELTKALSRISSQRSLDYHIKNIRIKIGDDGNKPVYLKTEYGIGYKLVF